MKPLTALIITAPILLAGCATNELSMTYYSDPPGASLIQADGKNFGRMPTTLTYTITDADRKRGQMSLRGMSAQWPSGAKASASSINSNLSIGTEQSFTFKRPANAPGLAADMNYALEVEKLNEMRRQTELQQQAKWDAERAARNAAEASEKARKKTYTCTRIGVVVDCQ
jgi:hypothetical protein